MDIKSPEERSRNMSKIKNTKTKPEMYIRSLFFRNGMRFRANYADVLGKPDLYFSKYNVAVFVHGCYWHRHKGCAYAYTPKSNVEFWTNKLEGNFRHDEKVRNNLFEKGVRVLIIWECTIKKMFKDTDMVNKVFKKAQDFILNEDSSFLEL